MVLLNCWPLKNAQAKQGQEPADLLMHAVCFSFPVHSGREAVTHMDWLRDKGWFPVNSDFYICIQIGLTLMVETNTWNFHFNTAWYGPFKIILRLTWIRFICFEVSL